MSDQQPKKVEQLPSQGSFRKLSQCTTLAQAFETRELRDRIAAAVPKHLDPDTMLRTFIQASSKTPLIYKCDLRQSLGAFMSLTYLGLVPGTVLGHAHLIPFAKHKKVDNEWVDAGHDLQVIIGYTGYVELAFRSGFLRDLQTGVVLPGEHFRHRKGTQKYLEHEQNIDLDASRLTPRAAYAVASLVNEGTEFEVMPWAEVIGIRNRSQAYQTAQRAMERAKSTGGRLPTTWTEAPWVRDEKEMGRKTVLRRLAKILPRCPELRAGLDLEDSQDAGKKVDFGPVIDGTVTPMDGLPEAASEDNEQIEHTADPGAAFGMREEQATTQAADPPAGNDFEAVVVDPFGEIIGEPHTDPVEFARALVALRARGDSLEALREHNADAIEEARKVPAAFRLLVGLDEPPADAPIATITVPTERGGKPGWANWAKAIKAGVGLVPPAKLGEWIERQRDVLTKAPMAQRALAVRAIAGAAGKTSVAMPQWVAELMQKAPAPTHADPEADADLQWVETTIADIDTVDDRAEFSRMIAGPVLRSNMARLRRNNPPLFTRIDEAFAAKDRSLPPTEGDLV